MVLHRDVAGRRLYSVLVVPLTSTLREMPTAVRLGPADGLDRVHRPARQRHQPPQERFVRRIGALDASRTQELCRALDIAVSCN